MSGPADGNVDVDLKEIVAKMQACEFDEARILLKQARRDGAPAEALTTWQHAIDSAERRQMSSHANFAYASVSVAGVGYLALSFTTPFTLGPPLWGFCTLLGLPALVGGLAGMSASPALSPGHRFVRGMSIAGIAVLLSSVVDMFRARAQISTPVSEGELAQVIWFVALAYGAIAGAVGGIFAMLMRPKVVTA